MLQINDTNEPRVAHNRVARVLHGTTAIPVGKRLPAPRPPSAKLETENGDSGGSAPAQMQTIWREWMALSERMATMMANLTGASSTDPSGEGAGDAPSECAAAKKIHTPLDETQFKKATEVQRFRPEIRRGKLYFSCPVCQSPTAVFKFYKGANTRCPKCFSAIRTPDLKRTGRAFNMERDVEALLHPDRFEAILPRRRSIATVLPLPSLSTALAACGIALLTATSAFSLKVAKADEPAHSPPALEADEVEIDTTDLGGRAIALVEGYLSAEGAIAKSAYVKDSARVARLMTRAFRQDADAEPRGFRNVATQVTGLCPAEGTNHFVTRVEADLGGGRSKEFIVEHLSHGDFIEWEASTGFNERGWGAIARRASQGAQEIAQLRVYAAPDDYFNHRFSDEQQHVCLRLEDPRSRALLGYGYASWEEAGRLGLLEATNGASSDTPEKLTLDLVFHEDSSKTRQVEIIGLTQTGWRAPDGTMFASAGVGEPE